MAIKTQGAHLYFIDTTGSDPVVRRLECPTGVTGLLGGAADQIDTTCMEDTSAQSEPGVFRTEPVTAPFVLRGHDEVHAGQDALQEIRRQGLTVGWFYGSSDGTDVPVADSDGENLIVPANRSGAAWRGYISNLTLDAAANEVLRGNLVIQVSQPDPVEWEWRTPA